MTLIAEDLLLILSDRRGTRRGVTSVDDVLGAALILDLFDRGLVHIEVDEVRGSAITVAPDASTEDDLLTDALDTMRGKPRMPGPTLVEVGTGVRAPLTARLAGRGLVEAVEEQRRHRTRTRWIATGSTYEQTLRQRLVRVVADAEEPDTRSVALLMLLGAAASTHLVARTNLPEDEIRTRIAQIADREVPIPALSEASLDAIVAVTDAAKTLPARLVKAVD